MRWLLHNVCINVEIGVSGVKMQPKSIATVAFARLGNLRVQPRMSARRRFEGQARLAKLLRRSLPTLWKGMHYGSGNSALNLR